MSKEYKAGHINLCTVDHESFTLMYTMIGATEKIYLREDELRDLKHVVDGAIRQMERLNK